MLKIVIINNLQIFPNKQTAITLQLSPPSPNHRAKPISFSPNSREKAYKARVIANPTNKIINWHHDNPYYHIYRIMRLHFALLVLLLTAATA